MYRRPHSMNFHEMNLKNRWKNRYIIIRWTNQSTVFFPSGRAQSRFILHPSRQSAKTQTCSLNKMRLFLRISNAEITFSNSNKWLFKHWVYKTVFTYLLHHNKNVWMIDQYLVYLLLNQQTPLNKWIFTRRKRGSLRRFTRRNLMNLDSNS